MSIQHDSDRDPAGAPSGSPGEPGPEAAPGRSGPEGDAPDPDAAGPDASDAGRADGDASEGDAGDGDGGTRADDDAAGTVAATDTDTDTDAGSDTDTDAGTDTDADTDADAGFGTDRQAPLGPSSPKIAAATALGVAELDAAPRRVPMSEAVPGQGLPAYRPPPSPAYAAPPEPAVPARARSAAASGAGAGAGGVRPGASVAPRTAPAPKITRTAPAAAAATITTTTADADPSPTATPADRRLGWQLLIAGLFLVVVAGAVAVLAVQSAGGDDAHTFGEVSAVTGDVTVRPGLDEDLRELEVGDEVVAGWSIEAADGAAATVDLAGGGVVRMDAGSRLRFVDLAVDPDTGERDRASEPAVDMSGGRAWLVPGPGGDGAVRAHIPDGVIDTARHPVAVDCTAACTVEAPTGGVTVTTDEGVELTPTTDEVLQVGPGAALELTIAEEPSAWVRRNLDADEEAGLTSPVDDTPGIVASAVLDGTYAVAITVVGPPTGDPIPAALQYPEGETYALELVADGAGCEASPCSVPVTSDDGISGTAQVRDGEVALTVGLPIDCYDESYTSVVVPGIGTTAVNATLRVEAVDFDGERWHARRVAGTGTVAATMTTSCNAGDVLGTSTSPITVAAS